MTVRRAVHYAAMEQGAKHLTAQVVSEESLPGFGLTWRIDADFAGQPLRFEFKRPPGRLVRQLMHFAPGTDVLFYAVHGSSA